MIRVFIGYDDREAAAFGVLAHSIHARASEPVAVAPVRLSELRSVYRRERNPLQSTDFSFSRFLTPWLCDYQGWAVFMDCDMLVLDDIAKLWRLRDERYAVQVVKHVHVPKEEVKFLGAVQTKYEKKNWSSVMLMNCAKCRALTPDYVNQASGLELHQFKWLAGDHLIGRVRRAASRREARALHYRRPVLRGVPRLRVRARVVRRARRDAQGRAAREGAGRRLLNGMARRPRS
jgi:hypothetical protein